MPLNVKPKEGCRWDLVALGEVMLRLDPRDRRVWTTRTFDVWEGGGEYNVARGLKRCFGLDTAVVSAFADNPVGRLIQDLIYQGGGKVAPGRPGLVGDHHHLHSGLIETADGRDRLGQQPEAAQVIDIAHLFVDGAVPVQEHRGLTHEPSLSQERAAAATSSTLMAVRQV